MQKRISAVQLVVLAVLLLSPMAAVPVVAQEQEQAKPNEGGGDAPGIQADVDVEREGESTTTAWYANPIWIAAGLAVLILLTLIIVLATRRGEKTTVIKS